jgi:2-phosphosulfolactate phosphatase
LPLSIDVFQTPEEIDESRIAGRIAVVIDVLRASTTMTAALHAGAAGIAAFSCIDSARAAGDERMLTGGERRGVRIEGFDLGNSPLEYTPERVAGREIRFTTSNGTRAITACHAAGSLVIGSFVNARAIVDRVRRQNGDVALVCAGTEGKPTLEDSLFAGLVCDHLCPRGMRTKWRPAVAAFAAAEMWRTASRQIEAGSTLYDVLSRTPWGIRLLELGRHDDVRYASEIDKFDFVPTFNRVQGLIVREVTR